MKKYKGIDVSLYQGDINWTKVKKSGIDFVFIKASQGRMPSYNAPFTDPKFEQNIKGAIKAGLLVGVYHYYCARNTAEMRQEAEYFINLIKLYKDKLIYAAVDVEDHMLDDMLYVDRTAQIKGFCDIVAASGVMPIVYTSSYWIGNYFTPPKEYPIWEANWSITDIPARAKILQYSSEGTVDGIKGAVDMNIGVDIIGDVNGDGKVNLSDAVDIMKQIAQHKAMGAGGFGQADVNRDGKVNLSDAVQIMKNIANK